MELNKQQKEELKKINELVSQARTRLEDFKTNLEEPAEEGEEEPDEEEDSLEDKLSELAESLESVESEIDDLTAAV